jgi:hypothetical protein
MVVNRSRYMILACQTGSTGGVSDPDAHTRERSHGPVRSPVGCAINTSTGANIRGRVFGGQVCLNDGPGRLDGVTTKGAASSKPQPNDAFLTLVRGYTVDARVSSALKQSSGEDLPAPHAHIDISRVDLDTAADAAGHFGCD